MEELFLTFALIAVQLTVFAPILMFFIMVYRVELLYLNYKKLSRGTRNKSVYDSFCYRLVSWLQLKKKQLPWYLVMFSIAYAGFIYLYSYRPSHSGYYWNFYTIRYLHYARYIELAMMLILTLWLYNRIRFIEKQILQN